MLTSQEITELADDVSRRAESPAGVILTAAAVEKVEALLDREGRDDLRLRVAVQPGGCAGLRYELFFDDRLFDADQVTRFGGGDGSVTDSDSGYESGRDVDGELVSGANETGDLGRKRVGFELVVERRSMAELAGATIDFVDTLQKQGFVIDNPNAQGSCACGDSFH
jgi:iron-sulfur cluster assembly accessory protein